MDPNLFHLDWERTFEALVGIVVLSFLVERACALLFESRWWISQFEDARIGKLPGSAEDAPADAENPPAGETTKPAEQKALAGQRYPLKEFIVLVLSLAICYVWKFDAVSIIMLSESTQLAGIIVTAAVVAGGSKASIALFHDLLKVRSSANEQKKNLQG
ncbi:MAG: hypothetical protein GY774_36470 [Planctomycetes bacterium]|nr:hypothetical protein [Planctomycetota bacterium]